MCGICGIYGMDDRHLVKKMTKIMSHRGPDDSGYYFDEKIGLGHRRLSIIDLKTGRQPIYNEDQSAVIVFNGEIYNFRELRDELEKKGHEFSTNTDTEVIVHLYEEYGPDCVSYLNGFFAFAIWDGKRLFIARDRAGIKNVYYSVHNDKFIFASEYKAILTADFIKRKVNLQSLDRYISLRYVPGNETMLEGIHKLPPGHHMTVEGGSVKIKRYWNLELKAKRSNQYSRELRELLEDSVKRRMISDVPVGAYLSGGIDSSSIVTMMSRLTDELKTFSIGFNSEFDETSNAREVAEDLGTDHHEFYVKKGAGKLLPKIVWHMDDPLGDTAIISNYLLAQEARKHVKVVLSGEGADELFGGYMQHKYMNYLRLMPNSARFLSPAAKALPVKVLDKLLHYPASMGEVGRQRLYSLASNIQDKPAAYVQLVSLFGHDDKIKLYDKLKGMENNLRDEISKKFSKDLLSSTLDHEFRTWLPDDILFKLDKITMANGLEGRVPFLDHRIIELASRMPNNIKIRGGTEKYILRKAMKKVLPPRVCRRKKHAFYMPVNQWFGKEVNEIAKNILDEKRVAKRGYFRYPAIRKIIAGHKKEFIYEKQMMSLLILEMWHNEFIDKAL